MSRHIIVFVTDGSIAANLLVTTLQSLLAHDLVEVDFTDTSGSIRSRFEHIEKPINQVACVVFIPTLTENIDEDSEELEVLQDLRELFPETPFLWISDDGTADTEMISMQKGVKIVSIDCADLEVTGRRPGEELVHAIAKIVPLDSPKSKE